LRPTITIRFDSKFQIIAQLVDSIRFEMKKTLFAHHYLRFSSVDLVRLVSADYFNCDEDIDIKVLSWQLMVD